MYVSQTQKPFLWKKKNNEVASVTTSLRKDDKNIEFLFEIMVHRKIHIN